jgi:hypothetical protein
MKNIVKRMWSENRENLWVENQLSFRELQFLNYLDIRFFESFE